MQGRNLKFVTNPVDKYFTKDKFGSIIPNREYLQMEKVQQRFLRQLKADTGLWKRLANIYWRTDVAFTMNPEGNTPTIGAGYKLFDKRPITGLKFGEKLPTMQPGVKSRIEKRARKIRQNQIEIMRLCDSLKPADSDERNKLLWSVEKEQVMTGGGFDGNSIGEVHKSGLNFVIEGSKQLEFADSQYSQLIVEGAMKLRDHLIAQGMKLGSLEPQGAQEVRLAQESDGMIGWPVYARALEPLTKEIATRLLIETGVDSRKYVATTVVDVRTGEHVPYRVIDAIADCLDHLTIDAADHPSIITLLARIQKHGWKLKDDKLEMSKSKTRSIYPNAAIPAIIEAMTINPFIEKMKELRIDFMPSLQDKPTRSDMMKRMITRALSDGYDVLSADWSKWDATVKGHILATIMYYALRPFYKAQWYDWVDMCIYSLCYKYLILDTDLGRINNDMFSTAQQNAKYIEAGRYTLFGMVDGLISGAKYTHVGGSMYGIVVVHYAMSKLLGFEPKIGAQAGDDTAYLVPRDFIDYTSAEKTYTKIQKVADQLGLSINAAPGKQIFIVADGELVVVFLQETHHAKTDTWGVGSIFRPYDAVFFSEHEKDLSVSEQLMAEIARMNQGSDNPFAPAVVSHWLSKEQVLGVLFKEQGANAFKTIIASIGLPPQEIAKRIDVGSFSWSISEKDWLNGNLGILPVMADVAAKMSFDVNAPKAFSMIDVNGSEGEGAKEDDPTPDQSDEEDGDILDD